MKRITAFLMAMVIAFSLLPSVAFAAGKTGTFDLDMPEKTDYTMGETIELSVQFKADVGLSSFNMNVLYDPAVFELVTDPAATYQVPAGMIPNFDVTVAGSIVLGAISTTDATTVIDMMVIKATLKVKDNAPSGATTVKLSDTATDRAMAFDGGAIELTGTQITASAGKTQETTVNIAAAPATYTVKVNGGTGVTANSTQTVNQGEAITDVVIEAWDDYYFPDNYGVNVGISGIAVTRNSPSKITVSGIPTADVTINLPAAAVKHENPDIPSVTPVHCTAAGNDGKITGVDASMEYKKGATGDTWYIVGNNTEIPGLAPGTYYVRYKATATQKASNPAEVVIKGYDPAVEKFTVTYKANGGTGADHSVQVDKGSNHVILGADACGFTTPTGMRLVYWSTTADNATGSTHYAVGQEYQNLQRDLTLYAVWETTDRTVFLNAGEGGGDEISETVTYDQTYTLPGVPETFTAPNGKEFDCWKIQGDNTNTSYNPRDSYTIKGNVKFVAQWKDKQGGGEQQGFTLTFKPGEGGGRDHVVNDINTQQYTLPDVPDTFTAPAGKPIFDGWKAEGGNVVYPAGTVIPVNADATFVAQWRADGPQGDTVLVTFKPGDGTGDAFELRVPAGDSYRLPAKPAGFKAPAGKVFAGWKIEDPQGNLNEKLYKAGHKFDLTEDVTFVAQWKTRPYYGDDTTTPDADPMVNPGTGAAPVGAPIAVVIAVAVAGAAYFVTTKKR